MTDEYNAIVGLGVSLSITPPGQGGVLTPIEGIEDLSLPEAAYKEANWTPQSGVNAGKEQVVVGSESKGTIEATVAYEATRHAALNACKGINGCAVVLNLPDGAKISGTGALMSLAIQPISDSKTITAKVKISLAAGWTYSPTGATAVTVVPTYVVAMTGGAVTVDLTACGALGTVNLTGKKVTKLVVTALSTNQNDVTIAKGAANGYEIISGYSEVLAAGEQTIINTAAAPTVGSGAKTLDVSGTGTQGVAVAIEAVTA